MQQISFNLEKYTTPQKSAYYYWQQLALDAIEYLDKPNKGQVFQWAQLHETKLKAALDYMHKRNINNFRYLAAMMTRQPK